MLDDDVELAALEVEDESLPLDFDDASPLDVEVVDEDSGDDELDAVSEVDDDVDSDERPVLDPVRASFL